MTSRILLLLLIASLKMFSQNPSNDKTPQLTPSTIKQVIAAMTLEEKVSLVVGSNPKPGASQTITFTLNAKDLSSFSNTDSLWVADAGKYLIKIGASCEDIKLTKSFLLPKDIVVEKVNKVLVPQVKINELKKGF